MAVKVLEEEKFQNNKPGVQYLIQAAKDFQELTINNPEINFTDSMFDLLDNKVKYLIMEMQKATNIIIKANKDGKFDLSIYSYSE